MADKSDPADAFFGFTKGTVAPSTDPAATFFGFDKAGAGASAQSADAPGLGYQVGQGALETAAGIGGLPTMLANIGSYIGGGQSHTVGSAGNLLKMFERYGLYNPESQPQNFPEQLARTGGGALATMPLGAAAGMGLAQNALYSFLPGLAADYGQKIGLPPLATAPLTALTMTGAENVATRALAAKAAADAAAQAAADKSAFVKETPSFRLGQQEEMAGTKVSAEEKKAFSEADAMKRHDSEHGAANTFLSGEHAGADIDREAVANSLGKSQTVQQGGEALQDAARTWKKDEFPKQLKDAEKKMYYNDDGSVAIPEDALGNLKNFRDSITNSFYKAGDLEPAAQQLRSRMPDRLESALDQIGTKQGLQPGEVPQATLADMKKLRSILGDAMSSPKLSEGVDAGKMNELYRALSTDMEGAISGAAGPEGVARFKKFNEQARQLYGLASGPVGDIISTTDKAGETILPGDAAKSVLAGSDLDGTKLATLSTQPTLDKGLKEVAASQLRTGTGAGVTQGDPDKFFTGLAPEAKTALFGDDKAGQLQNAIDRRTEAESKATGLKMQADKDLETRRQAAADERTQTVEGVKGTQRVARKERAEEGIDVREKAKQMADEQQMATDPNKKLLDFYNALKWHLGGGAAAIYGGYEGLMPRMGEAASSAGVPDWITGLGYPALGITGSLMGAGAREIAHNPAAVRNMLVGTMPITPATSPNALGFGVNYGANRTP